MRRRNWLVYVFVYGGLSALLSVLPAGGGTMDPKLLSSDAYARALALRDLTDAAGGPHALQLLLAAIVYSLRQAWGCDVVVRRGSPVVLVEDNYTRLGYPADAAARDRCLPRAGSSGRSSPTLSGQAH